eukprot:3569279-Amphidinium_carterae.1
MEHLGIAKYTTRCASSRAFWKRETADSRAIYNMDMTSSMMTGYISFPSQLGEVGSLLVLVAKYCACCNPKSWASLSGAIPLLAFKC